MKLTNIIAVAVAFAFEAAASSFTWTNNVVNTPDTAYDWNDGGNWQQGSAPGVHDSVTLSSKAVYVVSAHQRVDSGAGADLARARTPPRRGIRTRRACYAASSRTSTRSNDAQPSGASMK